MTDPDDPTVPTDINVNSITAQIGNIENLTSNTITSTSLSVSSSVGCNSLNSQSVSSNDITATEKLLVSNNAMIINNTNIESTIPLLGNSGELVGDYLTSLYPDSSSTYTLEQLSAGDNGSQSIILTAGGAYDDSVRNVIQSYDSYRNSGHNLWLNPLGGNVRVGNKIMANIGEFDEIDISGNLTIDNLTYTNGDKPVQAKPLTSSAVPNMEILFYHLTGDGSEATATMTLANNINETTNYAVFPSLYYGYSGSSGTYGVFDSFFKINVSNFTSTQFSANFQKGSGNNANVYIQFLVIYDMVGTDFPKSY